MQTLVETLKPVLLYDGAANAVDCDVISCKTAQKVIFMIRHNGANDTDLTLTLTESSNVAKGAVHTVTATCPIWLDADAGAASDTLVRQTDAASLVIDPATQGSVLAFIEWDPAKHTSGYDCIFLADTGGHGSNTVQIYAFVETRYPGETPPSVIVD